jgi:protein-tyrosine-phosphatase
MNGTSENKKMKILFVCYGNICRSPMASGIAGKRLEGLAEVASAGLAADGGPASEDAVLVMKILYKTDISNHVARNISDYDLASFDHVIAMDFPVYARLRDFRVIPDDRLYGWDIEDPLGRGYDAFKEAARNIELRLEQWIARLGIDA